MFKKKVVFILTIVLILLNIILAFGQLELPEPTPEFYVADYAGVLSQDAKDIIIGTNLNYEKTQESPQIVIATVPNIQGMDIAGYTVALFEKWKIGNKKYNNGVLMLLSLEDRKVRIEVGYGLEGAITDSKSGDILDSILVQLSDGDYSEGLINAFYQIAQEVNEEYGYEDSAIMDKFDGNNFTSRINTNTNTNTPLFTFNRLLITLLVIIFIWFDSKFFRGSIFRTILWILFFGRGGGRGGGRGFGGGSFGGGGRSGGGGADRGF